MWQKESGENLKGVVSIESRRAVRGGFIREERGGPVRPDCRALDSSLKTGGSKSWDGMVDYMCRQREEKK